VLDCQISLQKPVYVRHSSSQNLIEQMRLPGGDEKTPERFADGLSGPAFVIGMFDKRLKCPPLVAKAKRPVAEGLSVLAFLVKTACPDKIFLFVQFRFAQKQVDEILEAVGHQCPAEQMGFKTGAESLGAEVVGHSLLGKDLQALVSDFFGLRNGHLEPADTDAETIAGEVAGFEFVAVPGDFENADVRQLEGQEPFRLDVFDGHPLASDGFGIFASGHSNIEMANAKGVGDSLGGIGTGQAGLFNPEKGMRALTGGRVKRDFIDKEVFRT